MKLVLAVNLSSYHHNFISRFLKKIIIVVVVVVTVLLKIHGMVPHDIGS